VEKCLITQSMKVKIQKKGDNTKRRAVLPNEKDHMNFPGAGKLHRRASWQAALQDGLLGCTLRRVAEKDGPEGCPFLQAAPSFSAAHRTALFCSPPFCLLCSLSKILVFHLETWPSSPPAPQLVLSNKSFFSFQFNIIFP